MNIDIAPQDLKTIKALLHQYLPHTLVWAFGSRVKFTAKPSSDLDLVAFSSQEQAPKLSLLKEAFEQSNIPFRIDLHQWHELPETFHQYIENHYAILQANTQQNTANNWKTYKLSDIAQMIGGGTPKTTVDEYWNGNIPWLSVVDFGKSTKIVYTTEKTITEKGLQESSTKILKKGQLIISARGTVGELAMLGKDMAFNQSCYGLNATKETTNEFLYYLVKYNIGKIKQNTHGAVFDTITKQTFENIEVTIPSSIEEQTQIAQILSSLDDKIELNLQMNQTLEAIAQALFKEWFVEFKFPNFDGTLENGLPKGWRMGKLGEEFNLTMGQSPKGETYNEEGNGMVFYQGRTDFGFRFPTNRLFTTEPNRKANFLDTLVSVRAPVGDVNMANEECCIGRGLSAIRHKSNAHSYTYYSMVNLENIFFTFEGEGTVFGSINKSNFENIEIIVPNKVMIDEFEKICNPIDNKILENTLQIRTLTETRDALLPKLMSGQIAL